MCIERATVLWAVMSKYKAGEGVPCSSQTRVWLLPSLVPRRKASSSLEGKAFLRSHKTLNSVAFSTKFALIS